MDGLGTARDDLETRSIEEDADEYGSEDDDNDSVTPRQHGSRRQAAPQIFHETSVYHHVKAIRKFENGGFRMLKKLVM